ncbi:MAG: transporter, partial [Bdellovibrionales bacterium]|nr:transporter [Bdellovibrionales bacterium]
FDERLSLIATKDGYIDFNPDGVLAEDEGFANLGAGIKYAFVHDPSAGTVVSGIFRYEAPTGNTDVLQGKGDGEIQPSISAAMALTDELTFMGATGLRIAVDNDYSSFWNADAHVDYKLGNFYPLLEVNMVHVYDAGNLLPIADEGADLFNFGASGSDGKTLVTGAVGARYRACDNIDFGVAYQIPLTNGQGSETFEWRLTADMIYRFS